MEGGFDRDQTISDYAEMIQALLPDAVGFRSIDRAGASFFDQEPAVEVETTLEYDDALREILKSQERASELGRIDLGTVIAIVLPLASDKEKLLGVMTVFLDSSSQLTWEQASEHARPAIRSLERELTLRYRLVTSYKKLNVRSAEENLLHQVEKLVHLGRSCEDTLTHILLLCRKFLRVRGAALFIPDKHVRLFEGDAMSPVEARLLLSDMSDPDQFEADSQDVNSASYQTQDNVRFNAEKDVLALPVRHNRQEPVGILALSGWDKSEFSRRRRRRIGRYLVAHIEDVIARDYDALTGLMSWQLFEAKLLETCAGNDPQADTQHVVLYCDIDQFHVINETFGPAAADEILADFGRLLRDRMGRHMVTRVSGDTFAALVLDTDLKIAGQEAEELSRCFGTLERAHGDQTLRPSVSIGVAPLTGKLATASAAIAPAQVACKAAKDRGQGRVESYQQDDESIIQRLDDLQLVGHIRSAIENGRLRIVAQPIVALNDRQNVHYFEVLTRLINVAGEEVKPAQFFSSAERYRLMEELDRVVISKTLGMLAERLEAFEGFPLRIAINLSGQSLGSEQFLAFVEEQIKESGVPPQMLCFEITETVAVANLQRAQAFMHALKKLGCYFSLDDFGTGLSSFAYLKLFPVDTLKIDGSFVQDVATNVVSKSVVTAISEVAKVMELETVAEYVESEASFDLLKSLGVVYGQGFLFGEPEPLEQVLDNLVNSVEVKQVSA